MCFLAKKLILLVFLLISNLLVAQVNLQSGLVACYPFSGNANDATGNGNNGIVNGPVLVPDRFGNPESAYKFDGVNDYILINPTAFLNNTYTYSGWVNLTTIPTEGNTYMIISLGGRGGDQTMSINNQYVGNPAGWTASGYNIGGSNQGYSYGSLPITNSWVHVVSTRDAANLHLYINGVLAGMVSTKNLPPLYNSPVTALIGARSHSTGYNQFMMGIIDDMVIYNRALTADEVLELYKNGAPCSPEVLLDSPKINDMSLCGNALH